jgi:hypothetical protein
MKIYVASSWRNQDQPHVVQALRDSGHEVYDFRNPDANNHGFHWSEIDRAWQEWTPEEFAIALDHPIAVDGFNRDMKALREAEAVILVMPCGRSAHLEMGYAIGAGKLTIIFMPNKDEPELMYKMASHFVYDFLELEVILNDHKNVPR